MRVAIARRLLADDDLGRLDDRGHLVAGLERQIVDRVERDQSGDRISAANVDLDGRRGLAALHRGDLAGELIACAELHFGSFVVVAVEKPCLARIACPGPESTNCANRSASERAPAITVSP